MITLLAALTLAQTPTAVTKIEIDRDMCFGTCPAYTASLEANGNVRYNGEAYTPRKGKWTTQISPKAVRDLDKLQAQVGFLKLQDKYSANITDQPGTTVTVYWGKKKKSVYCYGQESEPAGFTKLAEAIDMALAKPGLIWRKELAK